ncbi:MAG: putative DNA-binding domain-containing protein [Rhodobacteraceae bacterium]|nr:putative DNA-binding domain-containing protein [Paracoccaceae bacterium]
MTVNQSDIRAVLLDTSRPVPEGLNDGHGRPAGRRFNVYRNNVACSLTQAMRTGFPVITKLIGEQNMDGLSGLFLRAHPPASPLMMHYGNAFPAYLEQMPQLQHLPYLADVARLELALRRAYHAADAAPIAPDAFGRLSPEALMQTRLTLAPSVEMIRSNYPIHGIWAFNMQDGQKPAAGAEDVLITRIEFDPEPHRLSVGDAELIEALQVGAPLGAAYDHVLAQKRDFDLGGILGLLLGQNAITSLTTKD